MSDYIGKRIVPKHCGEWDKAKAYEMLSIVLHTENGESYISRREVPAGTDILDGEYWAVCSRFSQQIRDMEIHLQETEGRMNTNLSETETRMAKDLHSTKNAMSEELTSTKTAMSEELTRTEQFLTAKVDAADENFRQGREEMNDNTASLKQEINRLIGSRTTNTELIDVRMDAEGGIHTTAGEAVRSIAEGLVPKILPAEVNVAVDKNYGNTAQIELKGRTVRGEFSYVGASYVGLFADFFGSYDAIRE